MFSAWDVDGLHVDYTNLNADSPIVLHKDGSPAPIEPEPDAMKYGSGLDDSVSYREPYWWTGRELDVEIDLQYNRAHWRPDPTPGRYIDEVEEWPELRTGS